MLHLNKVLCSIIFKNNDEVWEQSYEVKVFPYDNQDMQNMKEDDFIWIDLSKENKLLEVMYAYQFEKNYFSDQLLNRSHEASLINLQSSYIQIRDKLVENGYQSKYNLPARLWKMALKEAYDLHIRTHESQVALIKQNLNNNLYQYCHFELTQQIQNDYKDLPFSNLLKNFYISPPTLGFSTLKPFVNLKRNILVRSLTKQEFINVPKRYCWIC